MKPIVAIVGRPNVGKSTLFNRITRSKDALVDDHPGVTRDRHYGEAVFNERAFILVDTGGYAGSDALAGRIREQVARAIADCDAVIFLMDGKYGLLPADRDILDLLRPLPKPVFYAVNKIDSAEQEIRTAEFYRLGLETLYPVSAEHGYGLSELLQDLAAALPKTEIVPAIEPAEAVIRLAVVGRPNVGKSSLINRILGEERVLVSEVPGTTRDAIDTFCRVRGRPYLLIDTAGIRRKGRVSDKLEKFSVIKALRSLDRCDVALIVLDAAEGVTEQDITVAGYAFERGCGCILVLNKWDLVEQDNRTLRRYADNLRDQAKFLQFAPVQTVSALTGLRVVKMFDQVNAVYQQYTERIGTGVLNRIIEAAVERTPPALHRGRRIKMYYATQVSIKPPTFLCFVNYPEAVHFSYQRYLVNRIREESGLKLTPIRLFFRKREGRQRGAPNGRA